MVRDGYFYALACLAVGAVVYALSHSLIFPVVLALLACFFLWFFRDPERVIPQGAGLVVSPADGKVTSIEEVETPSGRRKRMSIFLNVFNVHVNRVPVGGQVSEVTYSKGLYLNAMNPDSAVQNERNLVAVTSPEGYTISFTQIAGLLARRIVCGVKPGDVVQRGQRMGLIKFGSRVDVVMPAEAEIVVSVGQHVSGGDTVLAHLPGFTEAQ